MKKLFIILSLFTLSVATFATTFRCNNNLGINNNTNTATFYRNFSEAYTAASNGDTIIVEPSSKPYYQNFNASGTHTGNFNGQISKSLTIVGNGYWINNGQQVNNNECDLGTLYINNANTNLWGIRTAGLWINASDFSVQRCYIGGTIYFNANSSNTLVKENFIGDGINNAGNYTNTGVIIANNILRWYNLSLNSTDVAIIENNVFYSHYDNTTNLGNANCVFRNNIKQGNLSNFNNATVENNIATGTNTNLPSGFNNINNATLTDIFVGTVSQLQSGTDVHYKLKAASPAIDAGYYGNGDDIGAYNDGTNRPSYRDAGIPPFPSIYQLSTGSVNGNSLNVTISTRANN